MSSNLTAEDIRRLYGRLVWELDPRPVKAVVAHTDDAEAFLALPGVVRASERQLVLTKDDGERVDIWLTRYAQRGHALAIKCDWEDALGVAWERVREEQP